MATKNLARTAIEGGRVGRNKWERRYSHTTERTSTREFCDKLMMAFSLRRRIVFIKNLMISLDQCTAG